MADFFNTETHQVIYSAHTPDYEGKLLWMKFNRKQFEPRMPGMLALDGDKVVEYVPPVAAPVNVEAKSILLDAIMKATPEQAQAVLDVLEGK